MEVAIKFSTLRDEEAQKRFIEYLSPFSLVPSGTQRLTSHSRSVLDLLTACSPILPYTSTLDRSRIHINAFFLSMPKKNPTIVLGSKRKNAFLLKRFILRCRCNRSCWCCSSTSSCKFFFSYSPTPNNSHLCGFVPLTKMNLSLSTAHLGHLPYLQRTTVCA